MNEVIKQAPQIIPVLTDPTNLVVNIIVAVVMFFTALVALFQVKITARFKKTKIESDIKLEPPDCHKIKLKDRETGSESDSFYMRMKVVNIGKHPAENVEVMINKCWKFDGEKKDELKKFLPMNLVWSHYRDITIKKILPKHFRHCDIGFFVLIKDNRIMFKIDTVAQPNKVEGDVYPNILEAGKYQLDLLIGADNVKTFSQSYILSFNDEFYIQEKDMFSKNIRIEKI
ncbi:MAG: hypothetical protein WC445_01775 [Patescibacteria group bacterium]